MAMKKRFLGLAMAAAITLPTVLTSAAYAATTTVGDKQVVEMGKDESENVTVPVTGTIRNKQGQVADRIEVELPSKMAFTVDADGNLPETKYTIKNNSANVNIELAVDSFTGGSDIKDGSTGGINLLSKNDFNSQNSSGGLYRNQISLGLTKVNGTDEVDLGDFKQLTAAQRKLGVIQHGQMVELKLRGQAGTNESAKSSESSMDVAQKTDVDTKGATDNFELVFSIKKSS